MCTQHTNDQSSTTPLWAVACEVVKHVHTPKHLQLQMRTNITWYCVQDVQDPVGMRTLT